MKRLLLLLLAPLLACAQPSTPINNPRLQGTGYVVTGASLSAQGTGTITATAMSNSTTMSGALDLLGSTRGAVLYRGASGWTILAPGTAGYVLATGGTGADPYWAAGGGGSPGGSNGQIQYNAAGSFGGFTMSGDATVNTGTGALTLANSGVSAGTYGSTTTIPAITIDAKGRITASSNSTPAFLPLVGGTMTGNITFGDAGDGLNLHGSGNITGASGNITIAPGGSGTIIGTTSMKFTGTTAGADADTWIGGTPSALTMNVPSGSTVKMTVSGVTYYEMGTGGMVFTGPLIQAGTAYGDIVLGGTPSGDNYGSIKFIGVQNYKNWRQVTNYSVAGAMEWVPSTTNGGSTFTTATTRLHTNGDFEMVSGNLSVAGNITAGTGPTTLTDSTGKVLSAALNTVAVAQGGTGVTSITANGVVIGNGTGGVTTVAPGTSGNVLTSNGTVWASAAATGNVTTTGTQTLTNKRITMRVTTITSSATPTVNTDDTDCVTITALAAAITSMTSSLSGTPNNFDKLLYRIKDDGTPRAITWGASFASRGATLPTTTTASKVLYVGFVWNSVASTWDCIATATES